MSRSEPHCTDDRSSRGSSKSTTLVVQQTRRGGANNNHDDDERSHSHGFLVRMRGTFTLVVGRGEAAFVG